MDQLIWFMGPLIGFLGMMSGGYWGVGCGWIVVPAMLIIGMDPLEAVGVGLLQMVPSTILTVTKQAPEIGWGRGSLGRSLAIPIGVGAMVTSLFGKGINIRLIEIFGSSRPIQWMLVICVSFIVVQTLFSRTAAYGDGVPEITPKKTGIALGTGIATGFVSSMLGLGGGIFIRPLLTSGFKIPEYYTSRIVRMLVLVTTVTGGATYLFGKGGFELRIFSLSMLVALGGVFGFPLGARMHKIVYNAGYAQHIHKSFAIVAFAVPVNTLLNMYGFSSASRWIMLGIAFFLTAYLTSFTLYAKKHPCEIKG